MSTTHAPTHRERRATGSAGGQRFVRVTLAVAGGVAVALGIAIAIAPRSFIDSDGEPTADLLSETRAPGAALLAVGVFIAMAAIRRHHLHTAAWMATLTYLGYGLARTGSMVVDGQPSATIIAATVVELTIGIAALAAVRTSRSGPEGIRALVANSAEL